MRGRKPIRETGQGYWVKVSGRWYFEPAAPGRTSQSQRRYGTAQGDACTPDWSAEIAVTDTGGGLQRLQIGVAPGTTPAYDPGCDRWRHRRRRRCIRCPARQATTEDVLADYQGTPGAWIVAFDAGTGADPISLAWNPASLPNNADGHYIQDRLAGTLLRVSTAAVNSATVTLC